MGELCGSCFDVGLRSYVFKQVEVNYHMKIAIAALFFFSLFFGLLPNAASACTVCMGANGTIGEAANGAIFVMLGVLGSVLSLIVMAGYSVVKRSQMPLPPHAELARAMSASNLK